MTSFVLRLIAIIAMLIDHTAAVLVPPTEPVYTTMRCIGRIAFPIFCFLIVEGLLHTRNVGKYMLRLGVFALLSEIPYDLALAGEAFSFSHGQNVFFTLLLGLIVIAFADKVVPYILEDTRAARLEDAARRYLHAAMSLPVLLLSCYLAAALDTDYGWFGVVTIWLLYILHHNRAAALVSFVLLNSVKYGLQITEMPNGGNVLGSWNVYALRTPQWYAAAATLPMGMYDGGQGRTRLKWAFYAFYPCHL
ncbi:MAG: hypothetical protein IJP17_03675, partial [Clostridia bacterium]|nr:hypothetical protein [Clostridia bacterium]